jgi:hypothetical protein
MNKETKILAPKPIRRSMHIKGESIELKITGPKSSNGRYGFFFHDSEFHNQTEFKINSNNFHKELEQEICIEKAKSEIFSILCKNESFSTDYDSNQMENINLRASMQPVRLSNPFLKNFAHEEEPIIDLKKFKTSSIFKSPSLLD